MTFKELELIGPIMQALSAEGYINPTPIQEQAIPVVLQGKDLLGCAQTGTGKTAAFAIPIIQLMVKNAVSTKKKLKTLVLAPTRELAIQVEESFAVYGQFTSLTSVVVFGGVPQKSQTDKLRRGVDILVATPGRLLDLMGQGYIDLNHIEHFVLDEADRMLDMGFINDIKKIWAKLPLQKQTLLFSATMPDEIVKLVHTMLKNPAKVQLNPVSAAVDTVRQSVYFVEKNQKRDLLLHLLQDEAIKTALVFTRTKHGANKVTKDLTKSGILTEAIHGNKSQSARQKALSNFKTGLTRVLVATDIAARGLDVDDLSHVINYELPNIAETYVHRIGRTGRAGATGIALSFCDQEEKAYLRDIQKLVSSEMIMIKDHAFATGKANLGTENNSVPHHKPTNAIVNNNSFRKKKITNFKKNRLSY
jgi:ATP-dependent RNA helicase RhlE